MAVANADAFARSVEAWSRKVPSELLVQFHKKIHLALLDAIVDRTPVDTGNARRNWQSAVGQTNDNANRQYGPDRRVRDVNALDAQVEAQAVQALTGLEPFQTSYIFNNTRYILFLEEGTPKMAAHKMVATSLEEIRQTYA